MAEPAGGAKADGAFGCMWCVAAGLALVLLVALLVVGLR